MEQLELKEILYKIKVDGDLSYLNNLIKFDKVQNLIRNIIKKYHFNNKHIKFLCETMIKEITIKNFNYQDSDYIEEQYLHYLKKSLGRKVRREINQDRPEEELMSGLPNDYENIGEYSDFAETLVENIDLCNALDQLEPDERYVLEKIYLEGYTEVEIAENFNMSRQNINKIKNKALIKLREILA